jgi:ATP synthase protein I
MDERDARDPLRDLEERLERARRTREQQSPRPVGDGDIGGSRSALALAFRIGLELVTAVVVGVAIGWAFDSWLGTRPWGMILFFFLGVGAGMTNVYRAVTGLNRAVGLRRTAPPPAPGTAKADWSEDED